MHNFQFLLSLKKLPASVPCADLPLTVLCVGCLCRGADSAVYKLHVGTNEICPLLALK